jgi:hypothetical protein
MPDITFVNVSHPGEIQKRHVQTSIRRHVMRDIGRSRRKKPRHKIVTLEFRVPENQPVPEETEECDLENHQFSAKTYRDGLYRSPKGSGILGIELDEDALQVVQFSKTPLVDLGFLRTSKPAFKTHTLITCYFSQ